MHTFKENHETLMLIIYRLPYFLLTCLYVFFTLRHGGAKWNSPSLQNTLYLLMETTLVNSMFTKRFLTPLVSISSPLIQLGVQEIHELANLKLQMVAI